MKKDLVPKNHKLMKRLLSLIGLTLLVAAICATFIILKHTAEDDYERKLAEKERLIRLKAQEEARSEEIEQYRAYVKTRGYMEEVAREVLGLVYEDEIIFRVEDDGSVSEASPTPTPKK